MPDAVRRAARVAVPALLGGGLVAASVPPLGLWPLGILGGAVLAWRLRDLRWRARAMVGLVAGAALYAPTLAWIREFTAPGYVLLILLESSFLTLACVLAGRRSAVALAPAMVIAEWARWHWPFGGLPMGSLVLGQAAGPLAPAARIGGPLLVTALAVGIGATLVPPVPLRRAVLGVTAVRVGAAVAVAAVLVLIGRVGPAGKVAGEPLRIAVVQGGGERGFRGIDSDPAEVLARHLAASRRVRTPVDLVLWPEDVIDVEGDVDGTPEGDELAALARRLRATVVAGAVEGDGNRFHNVAVAWGPDGEVADRYEKVHRVPFGEWVPYRGLLSRVVDLSVVPRDAVPGKGPGLLRTAAGDLGVVISYEVFDADRARAAVRAGGTVLLAPTNTASYRGREVPEQELASARLRAWETGRWVVQASPTGHSLVITPGALLVARTPLDEARVVHTTIVPRRGKTPYAVLGDRPLLGVAGAWLVLATIAAAAGRREDQLGGNDGAS